MRVGFDATPLLGPRSGVGTYTQRLVEALDRVAGSELELVATPFTRRGVEPLRAALPVSATVAGRRAPARALRTLWSRGGWPPVELLTGPLDVFHGTNFVAPPTRRARSVLTIHDLAYLDLPETVDRASLAYRTLVPAALRRGATVCAVSETMGARIREAYDLPAERVVVTPLGVDPSWFEITPAPLPPALAMASGAVVAVGTLEPRKNLGVLLDAYRLAAHLGQDLPPLVLVGAAGWGAALDTSGIPADRVVRTGHLPFLDLQQVVAQAALLVFPSRYEGFGLPPLESLATGVPVLASDLPVLHEVLGEQSRFMDAGAAEPVLTALNDALTHPAGTPASRRAWARRFTWEMCARRTLMAYSRLV